MKKSLALMLALIMVLCMIPTTAFAALNTGHKIDVRFTVLYVGDEFNIGYNYGTSEKNQFVCQYSEPHNDNAYNNHTIAISDIKAAADRATVNSGYQIVGWSKESNANPTVWPLNKSGTTACNKGNTIYLVAKNPNPQPTKPTKPSDDAIPGIVGESAVNVHCTNSTANHTDKSYGLKPNSYTVSDVKGDATSGYTCDITVNPDEYVEQYNSDIKVAHKLDPESQTGKITLKWDGSKWKVDSGVPVVFNVKCDNTQPPTDKPEPPTPPNTSKPFIELTGEEAVKVHCTNDKANHDDKSYGLMHDGYTVGDVEGNATSGYTCDITVKPEKYVEAYNSDPDINVEHKLDPESQTGTIHLKYDEQGWMLADPSGVPVVFKVKCDKTQPPLDPITIEVSKKWEDDIAGAQSITVGLYANGIKVKNATIRPDSEGTWFHRFDNMPANDSNGNPINYTVKEENIPDGYTPHYYTSGEHDKRLVFRVKNVPTDKTGAIKVSKELSGEGAEKDKEFAFTVTLLEYLDSNEVLDGGEPGYYPLSGIYTFGGFEFRDGKVTFGLKGGESVTISGIPAEYDYTVTESNNAGYTVTSENDKGTIRAKGTAEVKFTNTKSAAPTVSPTPTPTPGGGNGGGHWHPTTTPVPVIVIPPKTGDMTIWQSILHFLGIR